MRGKNEGEIPLALLIRLEYNAYHINLSCQFTSIDFELTLVWLLGEAIVSTPKTQFSELRCLKS